jgi:hypothetical protein
MGLFDVAVHAPVHARGEHSRSSTGTNEVTRDTPYTTRGTPRIRKRLYWRKEDAEAAERGDPEWWAKEIAKAERELRTAIARRYRTHGHL